MSGNKVKIGSRAAATVVKPAQVGLVIRLNGMQLLIMLNEGEDQIVNLGNFPVYVKVIQILPGSESRAEPGGAGEYRVESPGVSHDYTATGPEHARTLFHRDYGLSRKDVQVRKI